MTRISRRTFCKFCLWLSASPWLSANAKNNDALQARLDPILQGRPMSCHRGVGLITPKKAETRLSVPIVIDCRLPEVDLLALLVDGNPDPLVARINLAPNIMQPFLRSKVRLLEDSWVIAVARSKSRYFCQRSRISVTRGCD